jgi:hypothetical protein
MIDEGSSNESSTLAGVSQSDIDAANAENPSLLKFACYALLNQCLLVQHT